MRTALRQLLRHANFSEAEATVYLWLLRLGRSTIPFLREKTRLPNITVYRVLHALRERGVVTAIPLNDKQSLFVPLSLRLLVRLVEKEQMQLRKLQLTLKNLDPLLPFMDVNDVGERSLVEPIEMREGLDAFREEYFKIPGLCSDELLVFGSIHNLWLISRLHYEAPEEIAFRHHRMRRNAYARILSTPSPETEALWRMDSREKRTTRIVNDLPIVRDCFLFSTSCLHHFICDTQHPRVLVIRQPDLVAAHRQYFDALWGRG